MLGRNKLTLPELTPRVFSRRELFTGFFAMLRLTSPNDELKIDRLLPHRNICLVLPVTDVVNVPRLAQWGLLIFANNKRY